MAQAQNEAVRAAKEHCEKEGKQFVLGDVKENDGFFSGSVTVSGHCLGPGDPGYAAPNTGKGSV